MKHWRFVIKIVCFSAITIMTFNAVNVILTPKYLYNDTWPTTQTFTDFYRLEKDSIDVLFLGSSHCVSSFSPLELYETYGIRSYNLGSEQQNLLISYYWLKEALRYQSPQAVVLETYILFPYYYATGEALNSAESTQRKAIDYMRWSSVKREAIAAICENDKKQKLQSYYLPNIRFHTRWTDLNEDDFTYGILPPHGALMGYSALNGYSGNIDYAPFERDSGAEAAQPAGLMEEYLNRILQLCQENEIKLILVKTPSTAGNVGKYNFLNQYAAEHNVQYIDFNEKTLYMEIGYDFPIDNRDNDHLNIWGGKKVTDYIGRVLVEQYAVDTGASVEHEKLSGYYDAVKRDCGVRLVTDFCEYLDRINDPRYAVFISVKGEGTAALDYKSKEKLASLGITVSLDDKYGYGCYAVINGDALDEDIKDQKLTSTGTLRHGVVTYKIVSAGGEYGSTSSIIIDGVEYSLNLDGMNIVVYCLDTKKVIDSVCFDTHDGLNTTRQ